MTYDDSYKPVEDNDGDTIGVVREMDEPFISSYWKNEDDTSIIVIETEDEYIAFRMEFTVDSSVNHPEEPPHKSVLMIAEDPSEIPDEVKRE